MAQILLGRRAGEASIMGAIVKTVSSKTRCHLRRGDDGVDTTLLELVQALARNTNDDREIVATVRHLLRTGRVRLIGNFRGHRFDAS
jgi:hypothetical protein